MYTENELKTETKRISSAIIQLLQKQNKKIQQKQIKPYKLLLHNSEIVWLLFFQNYIF